MSHTPQPAQVPPFPGGQPPQPAAKPARNIVAIVALVVSLLGFVFAVMEGAYLLGWILLPIAFVLSLVGLFQKAPKHAAVAALIISIVGTIAGGVAFLSSMARVADEAFGGTTPSVVPAAGAPAAGAPAAAAPEGQDAPNGAAEAGSRENPHPLGTTITTDDWAVTINSYTPAATKQVLAENQFNDKPAEGQEYALVNLTVTRQGAEAASPMFEVRVDYVSASGNVFTTSGVVPDALSGNELFTGASATGNEAILVPSGDDGRLRVKIGLLGGKDVFFAIR